jgi:hypothetical protein
VDKLVKFYQVGVSSLSLQVALADTGSRPRLPSSMAKSGRYPRMRTRHSTHEVRTA